MKKLILLAALLVNTSGCALFCSPRDPNTGVSVASYREALEKIRANVVEIKSDIEDVTYDPVIKEADLQLMDATITLCDDTLAGKNAGSAEAGQ